MKNSFILVFCLLLTGPGISLFAQKGSWIAGVEGGPGLSLIYADQSVYSHSKLSPGWAAGIFGEYGFAGNFSARVAFHYERKGTRIDNHSVLLPVGGMQQFNLDYVSVPVLVKWNFGRNIRFFVNAGPCISLLLKQSLWYLPESGSKSLVANETDAYNPIDIAMTAGAGVAIPIGKKILVSVELRDNFGLVNIRSATSDFERDSYFPGGAVKGYTNSTLLMAGVAYRFGNGNRGLPCTPNDPDFRYIK